VTELYIFKLHDIIHLHGKLLMMIDFVEMASREVVLAATNALVEIFR
jgi:hypothetical protein